MTRDQVEISPVESPGEEKQTGTPLRVLIIEDSEDDALLLVRELRRGGYNPERIRVDTPEEMEKALREREWDIVVSDYYMPRFSGMDAYRVLQESGLDIPFIMVSGKIGEETAVEAMLAGVQDYIMKDNLHRLVPATQRELQEAQSRRERRRAEEELRRYREHLEELVRERTAELTREIAERKRFEIELRESEERYRTVSELITDYAYSYRVEPGFRLIREWLTGAFERITGYTREEMEGRGGWTSIVFKEDINLVQRPLKSLLSRQMEESFEYRIAKKEGEIRWLREYAHSLWSEEENRVVRIYGAVQDITDRKLVEESLRNSEFRYRVFADNTYDWEFWLTPDGRFSYTSPSCRRITGHDAPEFMENPDLMLDIIHPEDRARVSVHRIEERQKTPGDMEFRILLPDGSVRWLGHVCQPVYDERGAFLGTRGSNRDITQRHVLEENISRLRTEYEAFMRHEIRSLFLPIRNYTEMLRATGETLTDDQREYIRRIRDGTDQAVEFIDNLKLLQDIEAGNYPLTRINYPLKDIIQREIFHLRPFAEQHRVHVELHSSETNSSMPLDMTLMPGVFSRLIRNAIEHVSEVEEESERRVTVEIFNRDSSIVVKINNRGPTLSPERLATFFDKFNPGPDGKSVGPGLGTTYAALVTRAHGGDIAVDSTVTRGTTVTVIFPIKPVII